MKNTALSIGAVLALTALTASAADPVYSVNVVGYTKLTIPPGFLMIANGLDTTNNSVGVLLPAVESGTRLYKFDPGIGNYQINTRLSGGWQNPNMTLNPGEGVFIQNTKSTNITLLFSGEVLQGLLTNDIPSGFSIQSSKVPQAGQLDTDLSFPAVSGDRVYIYNNSINNYSIHTRGSSSWIGGAGAPIVDVGESFFVQKSAQTQWIRNYSATNP